MALGTQIFYYLEDTLAALQALETANHFLNEPLTWGHFVRDTTNDADYWVQPGTGDLVARLAGANYGGFSLFDGVTDSGTVESGEQILLGSTDSIVLNATDAAGTPTMTAEISGIEAATLGTVLTVGASGSITYVDPDTIGGFTITDTNGGSEAVPGGDTVTFNKIGGIDVNIVSSGATTSVVNIALDGIGTATNGQYLTVNSGTLAYVDPLTIAAGSSSLLSINGSNELSVSNLLITNVTENASATLAAFVSSAYSGGTEFQEGDMIILTTPGESYIHNGGSAGTTADFTRLNNPTGAIQNFTIDGDSGTSNTITDGETLSILGGDNVATVVTADTITVGLTGPISELANVAQPGTAGTYIIQYAQATDTYTYELASTVTDTSLADTDQTLTGARLVTQAANTLTFNMTGGNMVFDAGNANLTAGDLEIETATSGVILTAANANRYRITVNNIGALVTTIVV